MAAIAHITSQGLLSIYLGTPLQLLQKLLPDLITGIQNLAFYQKNIMLSKRIHNRC